MGRGQNVSGLHVAHYHRFVLVLISIFIQQLNQLTVEVLLLHSVDLNFKTLGSAEFYSISQTSHLLSLFYSLSLSGFHLHLYRHLHLHLRHLHLHRRHQQSATIHCLMQNSPIFSDYAAPVRSTFSFSTPAS